MDFPHYLAIAEWDRGGQFGNQSDTLLGYEVTKREADYHCVIRCDLHLLA